MIAMEALDQLLMACHSQSIKPFVESFLHMVAKLLESREPDLQVLGTNSVRPKTHSQSLEVFVDSVNGGGRRAERVPLCSKLPARL